MRIINIAALMVKLKTELAADNSKGKVNGSVKIPTIPKVINAPCLNLGLLNNSLSFC